jgi:hypothetical protein
LNAEDKGKEKTASKTRLSDFAVYQSGLTKLYCNGKRALTPMA